MEEKKEWNQTDAENSAFKGQSNQQNQTVMPSVSPMQASPMQVPPMQVSASEPVVCMNCGAMIPADVGFCPSCGAPAKQESRICAKCGNELTSDQQFCPRCGAKVTETGKQSSGKKKFLPLLIGGIAVVVVVIAVVIFVSIFGGSKTADMKAVYDSLNSPGLYVTLSSDEKSISIDTNPFDVDDYYDPDSWDLVEAVNDGLGLPDSVLDEMEHTSAMDGRISREYDGISVSWKYHPDKGLQVVYSLVE